MTEHSARRQQVIALILSGVFPGPGQFYNRQPGKGVVFLVAAVVLAWFLGRAIPADPLTLIQPEARLIVSLCLLLIA